MRGRKPIPTEIKRATGDGIHDSGGRKLPTDEPKASPRKPRKPSHLSPSAGKAWDRLTTALDELGVLSATDLDALTLCAEQLGIKADAYERIKAEGDVVTLPNGCPTPHPAVGILQKATTQAKAFLIEFGLTPSGRARVKVQKKEEEAEPFADLGGDAEL